MTETESQRQKGGEKGSRSEWVGGITLGPGLTNSMRVMVSLGAMVDYACHEKKNCVKKKSNIPQTDPEMTHMAHPVERLNH
jgi:hypothetical protein